MSHAPLFSALSSIQIAKLMRSATNRVVYAAPGIQDLPAAALVEQARSLLSPELTISLDFDERTLRMGYGSLAAVELLRGAGIEVKHAPGFRSGILIVDDRGWVFTPVAHYLEEEPQGDETPNAIELSRRQVEAFAVRFSPLSRQEAIDTAPTPEIAAHFEETPLELGVAPVLKSHFDEVKRAIETAPPVKFDVIRQVRVFEPYLQYVEISLTGAAIQKHKVRIPPEVQKIGSAKDIEGRLSTTFDLIEKSSKLSSKHLEEGLNQIRNTLTPSLGSHHGRAVMKTGKVLLEKRIAEFKEKLETHQKEVHETLGEKLAESRKQVVEYYLPLMVANPPDQLAAQTSTGKPSEDQARNWLDRRLARAFPDAADLTRKMILEVNYKDVTFETLNRPDFLESVKKAFPDTDWNKAYNEFRAAGENVAKI
jgi:hypothetical protein